MMIADEKPTCCSDINPSTAIDGMLFGGDDALPDRTAEVGVFSAA
jgi:hypothetical protein